jgi:hypothetical protein
MDTEFLARLNKAGGQAMLPSSATLAEREALSAYVANLRKFGHAIASDEVIESNEPSGAVRIFHYLTCRVCQKEVE